MFQVLRDASGHLKQSEICNQVTRCMQTNIIDKCGMTGTPVKDYFEHYLNSRASGTMAVSLKTKYLRKD